MIEHPLGVVFLSASGLIVLGCFVGALRSEIRARRIARMVDEVLLRQLGMQVGEDGKHNEDCIQVAADSPQEAIEQLLDQVG